MLDAFARIVRDNSLLSPGDRVLVAVSGGADSITLLHLLHALAPTFPFTILAAHLDHAIRPESRLDAEFVRGVCFDLGVALLEDRIDIPALATEQRRGLEETARDARRQFLSRTAGIHGCRVVALGHHRGDQAETVLLRLLRGSGQSGLAAMRLCSPPFIRPLLPFSRDQIQDFLTRRGLVFIEDASNLDVGFTRNRIRHQMLPLMREFNPRIEEHLSSYSTRVALEEDYWEEEEHRLLRQFAQFDEEEARIRQDGLMALHPAVRMRVLRRALRIVRGDLQGVCACHLEAVAKLFESDRPQCDLHLPGGWVGRRYEEIWIRRSAPVISPAFRLVIEGPGIYSIPGGGELQVSLVPSALGEERRAVEFEAGEIAFPLLLRSPQPGDRFRPTGMAGSKKLKDFLIDAKIPREQRRTQPVLEEKEILWIVGMRRCAGREARSACGPVLRLVASLPESPTINL